MSKQSPGQSVDLVLNASPGDHRTELANLLRSADTFLCMTAFARKSGLKIMQKILKERLLDGLEARFIIGLDFFHTDPAVLETLFAMTVNPALELFVSRPNWLPGGSAARNFHPKVIVSESSEGTDVLIGSANMTGGGLFENHEASILIRGDLMGVGERIKKQVLQLRLDKEIVKANSDILHEYRRRHEIYKLHTRLTEWRAKRAVEGKELLGLDLLKGYLAKMKADTSDKRFDFQVAIRKDCRKLAKQKLQDMLDASPLTKSSFKNLYEPLVAELWHSGGLERSKNTVMSQPVAFRDALKSIASLKTLGAGEAFERLLEKFLPVKGVGTNVLTEILATMDNKRFVVMNKNSVSGMGLAGYKGFPNAPSKLTVNATMYEDFCVKADKVRARLGLDNFSELDALFNYAYWD